MWFQFFTPMALKLLFTNLSQILWNWNQVCLQSQTNILVVNVTEQGRRNRGCSGGANRFPFPAQILAKPPSFKLFWITTCPTRFSDLPTALRRLGATLNWLFPAHLTYTSANTLPTLTFPRRIFWPLKCYGVVHKWCRFKICHLFITGLSTKSFLGFSFPRPSPLAYMDAPILIVRHWSGLKVDFYKKRQKDAKT